MKLYSYSLELVNFVTENIILYNIINRIESNLELNFEITIPIFPLRRLTIYLIQSTLYYYLMYLNVCEKKWGDVLIKASPQLMRNGAFFS